MNKKMLLICNPVAGRGTVGGKLSDIVTCFASAGYEVTVHLTLPGSGAEDAVQNAAVPYERVVCCGGDGTLNHLVNGLMSLKAPAPYGFLPNGSTNDFARSMHLYADTRKGCETIIRGRTFGYDIGRFNRQYFNYVAAFGAFTEVSYLTPQNQKNALGHVAYILEGIKYWPAGRHYIVKVTCDGIQWEEDYIYGSVSNTTWLGGLQMGNSSEIRLDDGKMELLLVKNPLNMNEANAVAAALLSRDFRNDSVRLIHTDSVTFEFRESTPWTMDGEYGGSVKKAEIRVCPCALKIYR